MKKEPIDSFFADKLQQAEIVPRAEAWAKLQGKMAKKEKKIVWLPFVRWSAAASVALLIGLGIGFMNKSEKPISTELASVKKRIKKETVLEKINTPKINQSEIQITDNQLKTKKLVRNKVQTQQPQSPVQQTENTIAILKKIEITAPDPKLETIATLEPTPSQQKTVRLELSEPIEIPTESITASVASNLPKQKRINKIFQQLKNLKNGDDVNWQEVGVTSPRLLARLNRE